MDFVWPPDWDVVARHVGYSAMVLSMLYVVLAVLDRMFDRFRHFFDLPGVIHDAYRWRRHASIRTPVDPGPDARETSSTAREIGDDHVVPTAAEQHAAAETPEVKAVDPRYKNFWKVDVNFRVSREFHYTLAAESRRRGKESADKLAEEFVERFVADLYVDPEALVVRRRRNPTSVNSGEEIAIKIGDGDARLLADHRDRIDWPPLLTAEFFAEIVKAGLAKIKASRRATVLGTAPATSSVGVGSDIHMRGAQQ